MNIDPKLLKEFEIEKWLYLDSDLSHERMHFWKNHIDKNIELKKKIESIKSIDELYAQTLNYDLGNSKFEEIISEAINHKNAIQKTKEFLLKILKNDQEYLFSKVAFASLLVVFSIIVSLTSKNPNPTKTLVQTVQSEILDWDAKLISKQINKVETLLLFAKNDDYKKYYINKITSNEWNKNTYEVENKIKKIKSDLGNNKF